MVDVLDGLSAVNWSRLRHAYGSAKDVPGRLAAMTDRATSADALDRLDTAVYHQGGTVYPAGAAVLPFLLRFAAEPAIPGRADILELIGRFAALHHEMREPLRSKPHALACRATLLGAFDDLLGLLDDPDPAVRRGAVQVLAELGERADDLADELMRRPGDPDPEAEAAHVLALSTVAAAHAGPAKRAAVAGWVAGRTPPAGDPRRLTVLVAARRLGHHAAPADDIVAAYAGAVPERTVGWLGGEFGADRAARIAVARIAVRQAFRTGEKQPLAEAGAVMMRWRSATNALAADIAAALDGPPAVQEAAVHLLAASGDAGRPWSSEVAALVGRPGRTTALATWALARWGDRRAVPVVERSLRGEPEIFEISSAHYADDFYWLAQNPSVADVCGLLTAYADKLVPAIRRRLRNDAAGPTAYQLTEVLTGYGAVAAAALPELTAMLDTDHAEAACGVLAALGPAAAAARASLTRLVASGGRAADAAAWALFRATGDPEPFLARAGRLAVDRYPVARMLGDLGPLARRHLPDIEQRLTEDPRNWPSWEGVELGFAHYRIGGDPALCLDVFDAALDPLRHGRQLPVSRQVLRYLVTLGPAAARFTTLLDDVVTRDERLAYSGGWRGITEDEEAQKLAGRALAVVAPGAGR